MTVFIEITWKITISAKRFNTAVNTGSYDRKFIFALECWFWKSPTQTLWLLIMWPNNFFLCLPSRPLPFSFLNLTTRTPVYCSLLHSINCSSVISLSELHSAVSNTVIRNILMAGWFRQQWWQQNSLIKIRDTVTSIKHYSQRGSCLLLKIMTQPHHF